MAAHDTPDETRAETADVDGPPDADLIAQVRSGRLDAYGELFRRHYRAAHRLAGRFSGVTDVDDLVSEGFARVLDALTSGTGPEQSFRPYLLVTIRRLHVARLRAADRMQPTDDDTVFDRESTRPVGSAADPVLDGFDENAAARAFAALPERWQAVLWHTEIEGQRPADVAPLLGLSANAVSALAYRARERLRREFLQQHVSATGSDRCRRTTAQLSGYTRRGLPTRENREVRKHLDECPRCAATYLELTEINRTLPAVLAPALLGTAGLGYLAVTRAGAAGGLPGAPALSTTSTSTGSLAAAGVTAASIVAGVVALIAWSGGPSDDHTRADAAPPAAGRIATGRVTPPATPAPRHTEVAATVSPAPAPTDPTPRPSPTATPTALPTYTPTPAPTPSARPTVTPTVTVPTPTPTARPTSRPSPTPTDRVRAEVVTADEGLARIRSHSVATTSGSATASGGAGGDAGPAVRMFKVDLHARGTARAIRVVVRPGQRMSWRPAGQRDGWTCTPSGAQVECRPASPVSLEPLRLSFDVDRGRNDGFSFEIEASAAMADPAGTTFTDTDHFVDRGRASGR